VHLEIDHMDNQDNDEIEVFVIGEAPVATDAAENPASPEEPDTGFAVHLPDQPPEEGGPVWIVEASSPEEHAALQEALDEGLVTEVPSHLLESEPVAPDDTPENFTQ
jgi:hypothetical protein